MDDFVVVIGCQYKLFEFCGYLQVECVIVIMGLVIGICEEVVDELLSCGEKVGVLKVCFYCLFFVVYLLVVLLESVCVVVVLDCIKEFGVFVELFYFDVMIVLVEVFNCGECEMLLCIIGGCYGFFFKEFGLECVLVIFSELQVVQLKLCFIVGIYDDVINLLLLLGENILLVEVKFEVLFYGFGSDGSVLVIKNNIKIIGNLILWFFQGYFVYDLKKVGGFIVLYLWVSEKLICLLYLILQVDFVGCYQLQFIDKYQMVEWLKFGGIFLFNMLYSVDEVWFCLFQEVQVILNQKKVCFYVVNVVKIVCECSFGVCINIVMQMVFFYLIQILLGDSVLVELQVVIVKSYSSKGQELVECNWQVLVLVCELLVEVLFQLVNVSSLNCLLVVFDVVLDFVKMVIVVMLVGFGDVLLVFVLLLDGIWFMGIICWEKCNIVEEIFIWKEVLCIQCNYCVVVCLYLVICVKVVVLEEMENVFVSLYLLDVKFCDMCGQKYVLQVVLEDCIGCNLCVEVCLVKDCQILEIKVINMMFCLEYVEEEKVNYEYFFNLLEIDCSKLECIDICILQLISLLFEYFGVCLGCGEMLYIKLLIQLYGD